MIPVIASFVLAPMDAKAPDVERVFRDLRDCLNTFDEWAEGFLSASALEVDQVFKVGEEVALVAPASSKTPSNTCLLYTSPSPRDRQKSRMPSSA